MSGDGMANDYDELPEGALVSDATTLSWLGLTDKGWFARTAYKAALLHLRHKVFGQGVIVFVHGFTGDYVSTWGKRRFCSTILAFNRNYDFVFYGFKTTSIATCRRSEAEAASSIASDHLDEDYKALRS